MRFDFVARPFDRIDSLVVSQVWSQGCLSDLVHVPSLGSKLDPLSL